MAAVHVLSEVDEGISMKKKFKWKHRLQMKIIERMQESNLKQMVAGSQIAKRKPS